MLRIPLSTWARSDVETRIDLVMCQLRAATPAGETLHQFGNCLQAIAKTALPQRGDSYPSLPPADLALERDLNPWVGFIRGPSNEALAQSGEFDGGIPPGVGPAVFPSHVVLPCGLAGSALPLALLLALPVALPCAFPLPLA